ncbi:MAG TPA: lysophospholipid acyltransferase family protein [Pyrinomonadaceae bacterium]|nr:lysophospholipid acyltransferase family protein [Pyrinomonadaceae bacterium]
MSEPETSVVRRGKKPVGERRDDPYVLPRWAIHVLRAALRLLFRLLWRMRYVGVENVPVAGGVIIAANHQTYLDPFWLGAPVPLYSRFLAWDKVFDWPVAGKIMRLLGAWPLQQKGDRIAFRRSLQWLRGGGALVIFPEGGRSFSDGRMQEFKVGAVRLALQAGVPILPVTIRGGHRVWPRDWRYPRFGRVEIVYHPLQHLTPLPGEDTRQTARRETDKLYEIIHAAL